MNKLLVIGTYKYIGSEGVHMSQERYNKIFKNI